MTQTLTDPAPATRAEDSADSVVVVVWNVEHNGVDKDGSTRRREIAHRVLAEIGPHIVLRQEMTGAWQDGNRARHREANRLGLASVPVAATPESPNPAGVFYDPALFELDADYQHVTNMWHPICNPVVRLKGTTRPLSLASFHLCSFDPATRATEAKRLTVLGKPGMSAIIGGDTNSYVHRPTDEPGPLPDWDTVADPTHFEHRTVDRGDGTRVCDTVPDEILAGGKGVFTELGHYAGTVLGQRAALLPTASLWRTDQGRPQRIDRAYCTPDLRSAVGSVRTVATGPVREASDHGLVVAEFDRARLRHALTSSG